MTERGKFWEKDELISHSAKAIIFPALKFGAFTGECAPFSLQASIYFLLFGSFWRLADGFGFIYCDQKADASPIEPVQWDDFPEETH
jgi:hypothetical protein